MIWARSQPKSSEIGLRNTVKLSPRPRPSTDNAKHSASTLSATRAGFSIVVGEISLAVFWSITSKERVSVPASKGLERMRLCRLEQDVALLADGQFYHAFRCEIPRLQHHLFVGHGNVVDAKTAALDLTTRLAVGGDEAGLDEQPQHAAAGFEFGAGNFDTRKVFRDPAFLKGLPCGFRRRVGRVRAVQQRGRGISERLLGFVDLRAL